MDREPKGKAAASEVRPRIGLNVMAFEHLPHLVGKAGMRKAEAACPNPLSQLEFLGPVEQSGHDDRPQVIRLQVRVMRNEALRVY